MKKNLILFYIILHLPLFSQVVGSWDDYFNTRNLNSITRVNDNIYTANSSTIIEYNTSDFGVRKINKINLLNDIGISGLYNINQQLFITYSNGNIDVLINGVEVINIPDIKINNNVLSSKRINDVQLYQNEIYIATDFGIVVLDLESLLVKDTYFFDINNTIYACNKIEFINDSIYVLSDALIRNDIQNNLKDFNTWDTLVSNLKNPINIGKYNDKIIVHYQNFEDTLAYLNNKTITPINLPTNANIKFIKDDLININDTLYSINNNFDLQFFIATYEGQYSITPRDFIKYNNTYYFADQIAGLIKYSTTDFQYLSPTGPNANQSYYLNYHSQTQSLLTSTAHRFTNNWSSFGANVFKDNNWSNKTIFDPARNLYPRDIIDFESNENQSLKVYASNFDGLVVEKNNQLFFYDENNSTFNINPNYPESCAITGLAYNHNYFVIVNSNTSPYTVYLMDQNLNFYPVKHNSFITGKFIQKPIFTDNYIIILPTNNGLVFIDTKGTFQNPNDDVIRVITESNSELPSNNVNAVAIDLNDQLIIGTNTGFAISSNWQSYVAGNSNINIYQPLIEQDGFVEIVLGETPITNICVDPSNRKWIATKTSGAYLLDENMKYQELYFNPNNSPLLEFFINDIAVEEHTGKVFFSSSSGIISYQNNATNAGTTPNDIIIYPSPVPVNYNGNILIKQTPLNSSIRITDVNGNLVRNLNTQGGAIEWNLKNTNNEKVSPGIYYFIINSENDQSHYTQKILVK